MCMKTQQTNEVIVACVLLYCLIPTMYLNINISN